MSKKKKSNFEGLFITFEGGEGGGKSTLIQNLYQALSDQGYTVVKTREPGGSPLGDAIRSILLKKSDLKIFEKSELLLFLASRVQHLEELILPAIKEGKIVLSDRFNDSSVVYQGYARELGMEYVKTLYKQVCGEFHPDLTFFLDIDPAIGLERSRLTHKEEANIKEMDRLESEKKEFHKKVRGGYKILASQEKDRFVTLDATLDPKKLYKQAIEKITPLLNFHDTVRH